MKTMYPPDHRSSPQWLCGNSCTWAHDVRLRAVMYDGQNIYIYI